MDKILILIDNKYKNIIEKKDTFGYLLYQLEEIEYYRPSIQFITLNTIQDDFIKYINMQNYTLIFIIEKLEKDEYQLIQNEEIVIQYNNKFDNNKILAKQLYDNLHQLYTTELQKYKKNKIMNKSNALSIHLKIVENVLDNIEIYKNITKLFYWRY